MIIDENDPDLLKYMQMARFERTLIEIKSQCGQKGAPSREWWESFLDRLDRKLDNGGLATIITGNNSDGSKDE